MTSHATRRTGGPRRSLPALAAALARAWWPQVAALAAAAAVVAATITGALGVGSALRGGLRSLALERLGAIDAAVVADEPLRAELAGELAAGVAGSPAPRLVPAIVIETSVEAAGRTGSGRRSARATLLACDDLVALGFAAGTAPSGSTVLVNAQFAAALGISAGADVVVRAPPRSAVPADTPLGRRGGLAEGRRFAVAAVLPDAGLGRFALEPAAATRPLVVTTLAAAQDLLGREGTANVIFAAGPPADDGGPDVTPRLTAALHPRLEDLGLALEPVAAGAAVRLTSRRLVLPPEVDRAAAAVLAPRGGHPTLAFLATSLVPLGDADSEGGRIRQVENLPRREPGDAAARAAGNPVEIPYSTVLGIDATTLAVGDLEDDDGRPLAVPADDEIVIDRWVADDLAARGRPVAVGDRLELRFFLPETLHGKVGEAAVELRIAGIAAMRGLAVERALVPDVDGVTDEASIADWDPPFPFDRGRIRATPPHDEDERYWQALGAAPKAFVSLATARRIAGSRFGETTAWFLSAGDDAAAVAADLAPRLAAVIDPTQVGVRVVPVRARALAAARGATPFGGLFLALSSFVVVAGLLLEWLLFELLVTARMRDVGLLAAVGWPPARIGRLLLAVGGLAAVGGTAVGSMLGPAWARGVLAALAGAWQRSVEPGVAAAFACWPEARHLWPGAVAAAAVSLAALAWAARRAARVPPAALLAGRDSRDIAGLVRPGRRPLVIAATGLAAALACGLAGRGAAAATAVGLFFVAGVAALGGFLALVWWWLSQRPPAAARSLAGLARRGLAQRRGRAFAVAASVAVAAFLVVAVSAFRLSPSAPAGDRHGPSGGFTHVVSFAAPTAVNPADPAVRAGLGLDAAEDRAVAACDLALVRSSGGVDANCTNLYAAAGGVGILGVGPGFIARDSFRFTSTARPVANPWTLLDRPDGAAGPVPAILDAATAQWALKLGGVGARFTVPDAAGRPVELEIVGLLDLSILQGFVIVAEREFARMFPDRSGCGLALVDGGRAVAAGVESRDVARALAAAWADAAPEVTATAERVARLQAVQNTFLAAFQALGMLGLLLGTAGVAAVQAQGVAERRGQLAVLRAVGFRPARLRQLLALETLWTVGLGLAAGIAAGLVAVAPSFGVGPPLAWVAGTAAATLLVATLASLAAASWHAIPERPAAE